MGEHAKKAGFARRVFLSWGVSPIKTTESPPRCGSTKSIKCINLCNTTVRFGANRGKMVHQPLLYTLGTYVIFLHIPKLDCKRGNTDPNRESTRRKETLSTTQKRNDFRSPRPEPVPLAQAFSRTAGLLPNVGQPSTDQNGSGEPCLPKLFQ